MKPTKIFVIKPTFNKDGKPELQPKQIEGFMSLEECEMAISLMKGQEKEVIYFNKATRSDYDFIVLRNNQKKVIGYKDNKGNIFSDFKELIKNKYSPLGFSTNVHA